MHIHIQQFTITILELKINNAQINVYIHTYKYIYTHTYSKRRSRDLREGRALSPNATVMANNGSGGEMLAGAVDITHQMIIHVSLPRHFLSLLSSIRLN